MDDSKADDKKWLWLFLKIGGAVTVAWLATFVLAVACVRQDGLAGQFGDVFGSINALFSGLAFAGVIVTVWMQREELKLQRQELEATRAELRGQKEQMELQNETLQRQQFEATFFQTLAVFSSYIDQMAIGSGSHTLSGSQLFRSLNRTLLGSYKIEKPKDFDVIWEKFLLQYREIVEPFVRLVKVLLNQIQFHAPSRESDYYVLVRARLDNDQLVVLFFAGLSAQHQDLRFLAEKCGLFRYLTDSGWTAEGENLKSSYDGTAYH